MKTFILILLTILFVFQVSAQYETMHMTTNPFSFEPQATDYTFQNGTNYLWITTNSPGRWYEFASWQITGDLDIQEIDLNPTSYWYDDPFTDYFYSQGPACGFSLSFTVDDEDQHPTDDGIIVIRRRSATDMEDLPSATWYGYYITVNVDDPTVSTSDPYCYSGNTVSISNYPGFINSVSWSTSSNLRIIGSSTGTSITVGAKYSSTAGSGWVKPQYNTSFGTLNCYGKAVWAGKPGVRPTWPAGNPTPIQASVNDYVYIYPDYQADQQGATGCYWTASGAITRLTPPTASVLCVEATSTGYGNFYLYSTNVCGTAPTPWHGQVYVSGGRGGGMKVSPIPADSYIEITFDEDKLSKAGLLKDDKSYDFGSNPFFRIVDKLGEVKITQKCSGEKLAQINTSKLPPGLYTLQLVMKDKVFSTNIMVSR